MKKILFLALVFLQLAFLQSVFAVTCCVDAPSGVCSQPASGTCPTGTSADDTYTGAFCTDVAACAQGCCCALPTATNPDAWNLDPDSIEKIQASCDLLGPDYAWTNPVGDSCLTVCGGVTATTGNHTINGTVTNGTGPLSGANVQLTGTQFQATTNAAGAYSIANVPEMQGQLTASYEGCVPSTNFLIVDDDETRDFALDCETSQCEPTSPGITAEVIRGTPDARLTLTSGLSCGPPTYYQVIREDRTHGREVLLPTIPYGQEYVDEHLEPNTEYCYAVAAEYGTGQLIPSTRAERATACITTGATECMNVETDALQWCNNSPDGSAVMSCTDNNALAEQACSDGQTCAYVGNNQYGCVDPPPCAECNGLFGMLPDIVFSLFFLGTERTCNNPDVQRFCFEDRTDTTLDAHRSCAEVTNCEDYRSQTQCGANPCVLPATCAWQDVYPELGKGICRSINQQPACGSCEDIFGTCNDALCEAIGDRGTGVSECYYDAQDNGLDNSALDSRCRHKDEMACRYYDTSADCGVITPDIDVTWTGDDRTGGTHEQTRASNDKFAIGYCNWEPVPESVAGGFCYKDADEFSYLGVEDDCIDNGVFTTHGEECLQDATPPQTSVILPESVLGIHEVAHLDFVVSDNYYTREELEGRTWFCLQEADEPPCYPDKTLSAAIAALPDYNVGDTALFTIRYYSYDLSGNLEVVQSTDVTLIEQGYPRVENAELRE